MTPDPSWIITHTTMNKFLAEQAADEVSVQDPPAGGCEMEFDLPPEEYTGQTFPEHDPIDVMEELIVALRGLTAGLALVALIIVLAAVL